MNGSPKMPATGASCWSLDSGCTVIALTVADEGEIVKFLLVLIEPFTKFFHRRIYLFQRSHGASIVFP